MKEEGAGELVLGGLGLCFQQEVEEGGAVGAVGQDRWDLEHMVRGLPHDSPSTTYGATEGPLQSDRTFIHKAEHGSEDPMETSRASPGPSGLHSVGAPPGPTRKAGIHSGLGCPHEALGSKRAPA